MGGNGGFGRPTGIGGGGSFGRPTGAGGGSFLSYSVAGFVSALIG